MSFDSSSFTLYPLSEKAITIEFGDSIDELLLQTITNFNQRLQQHPFPGMLTTVPAYTTLTVFFDPLIIMNEPGMTGGSCFEKVAGYLEHLKQVNHHITEETAHTITIPVCYGGEYGPDLEDIARMHDLTVDEVIRLHSAALYKVYMIGFVPGFAYLGGLPEILASPRKSVPRNRVPAGAVGIAGKQTGIYPFEIPGGWQIIGQTPLHLFNPRRSPPLLLNAGDSVQFMAVSLTEFQLYSKNEDAAKN